LQDSAAQALNGEFSNSALRREFYQHRGSNSDGNIAGNGSERERNGKGVSLAGAGKIQDIQTNFGEMVGATVNPAPAAFSPQFTRKEYRSPTGRNGRGQGGLSSVSAEGEADCELEDSRSGGPSPPLVTSTALGPIAERIPKTVFIRSQSDPCQNEGMDSTTLVLTHSRCSVLTLRVSVVLCRQGDRISSI
jgi:hypothetical protein